VRPASCGYGPSRSIENGRNGQYRGSVQHARSAHHLAPDPVSENAGSGYLFLYESRFARGCGWSPWRSSSARRSSASPTRRCRAMGW
jgi:hypothetical protein